MKNVYQCEKCGQLFVEWGECSNHESMHWTAELETWDRETETFIDLASEAVYQQGQEMPKTITVRFYRYNPVIGQGEHIFGKYEFGCFTTVQKEDK